MKPPISPASPPQCEVPEYPKFCLIVRGDGELARLLCLSQPGSLSNCSVRSAANMLTAVANRIARSAIDHRAEKLLLVMASFIVDGRTSDVQRRNWRTLAFCNQTVKPLFMWF